MPRVSGRGLEVLHVFKDQHNGDDECVWLLWQLMFDGFGDLKSNGQCVHPKKRILVALWEL